MPARKIANPDGPDQGQKQPSRPRRAILTGGAVGLAAVAGSTFVRAQPASAQGNTQPVVELLPANPADPSGATDAANINEAFSMLPSQLDNDTNQTYQVGQVLLAPGDFYINSQITKPPKADLIGSGPGTVIHVVGDIIGIYSHHSSNNAPDHTKSGTIANLVVDGTQAGNDSIGIDVGDGWGHHLDHVWVNNFMGTNAIGLSVCNRFFWTEKFSAKHVSVVNNTTAVKHWTTANQPQSQEYQDVEYFVWVEPGQNGLVFQGVQWNGRLLMQGNIGKVPSGATNAQVSLLPDPNNNQNPCNITGQFYIRTENNPMGTTNPDPPTTILFGDSSSTLQGAGFMRFNGGTAIIPVPGQFQFRGMIQGEGGTINTTLQSVTTPPFPETTGTSTTNLQNDANIYITGGTIQEIKVNGVATGITATTGQVVSVFLPAGGTITIAYSGSPSWTWISAL